MILSNCCGAECLTEIHETDGVKMNICRSCKEHAEFVESCDECGEPEGQCLCSGINNDNHVVNKWMD